MWLEWENKKTTKSQECHTAHTILPHWLFRPNPSRSIEYSPPALRRSRRIVSPDEASVSGDDGLLSNLAGSLRERRVSLKHMAYHGHGKLMLAQKHLAGDVSLKGGQFFIAVRTRNCLDVRIHGSR